MKKGVQNKTSLVSESFYVHEMKTFNDRNKDYPKIHSDPHLHSAKG